MKNLSILFLFITVSLYSITNEARFDMLTIQLKKQLKNNQYKKAIITFDKIKSYNQKLPVFYDFYEGKANFEAKNYDKAYLLLDRYITKVKRKGKYYKYALPMLISIEELKNEQNKKLKNQLQIQKRDIFIDNDTGLIWQNTKKLNFATYKESNRYCNNLNLMGYNDWYLPSLNELKTLIDKKNNPQITKKIKDVKNMKNYIFWANDPIRENGIWSLDFETLYTEHNNINSNEKFYVRCLRN